MPHHVCGAVDIGGTKIAAGLVDDEGGILRRVELPTPGLGPAQEVLATVVKLIDALAEDPLWPQVSDIGIGSAGPVDPRRGTVSPVNIPGWRDFPLVARVAAAPAVAEPTAAAPLGRTVSLIGDGLAMAAGEHWRGAARGHDDALCLVVSTGVGAGLIMNGMLRSGPSGNAGHLGHIVVDMDGEDCACGSRGCVETVASGTAIARWAVRQGWKPEHPRPATAIDVAAAASNGDEIASAAFDRAARALAAAIASAAALNDIRVAVVGGGVAKAGALLFDPLRRHLDRYASLPYIRGIKVLPAELGPEAGLIGASAVALAKPGRASLH